MKRCILPLAVMAGLAFASPAMAATELVDNGTVESSGTTGRDDFCGTTAVSPGPMGWSTSCWSSTAAGLGAFSFKYLTEGTNHALQVTVSNAYTDGDAKWIPSQGVDVKPNQYYLLSDRYKSNVDSAVSVFYQTAAQVASGNPDAGTWLNLDTGIAPSPNGYTKFSSGIHMPADAAKAYFVHFLSGPGQLTTDDYSMQEAAGPPSLNRGIVSLTFDDSTPNLYNVAIPELEKFGFKSTQYVVTGATGARDDNGVLFQWSADQIKDVHMRGHEIGSHTEYHPNLAKPGPKTVCEARGTDNLPTYTAASGTTCPAGTTFKTVAGSWLDPMGGAGLLLQPATVGSPTQALAATTLRNELADSKKKLEQEIGFPVTSLAYPYGSYSSSVINEAKADGYVNARSVDEGYNGKVGMDGFKIRVQNIAQAVCTSATTGAPSAALRAADGTPSCADGSTPSTDVTPEKFQQWLDFAKQNKYWLVLVYHSVDDAGINPYGTSVARFRDQMNRIKASGMPVETMRDALNEVMPQIPGSSWKPLPVPDFKAPETTIAGPDMTDDHTPTFTLGSDEQGVTFKCSIDGGAFTACTSPFTTGTLADGRHTLLVQATDKAGNLDTTPASKTFTVFTRVVEPPIVDKPIVPSPIAEQPKTPTTPTTPSTPSAPATPSTPSTPTKPATPSKPAKPADHKQPRIRVTAPKGKKYARGSQVRVRFSCSDDVKVKKCVGTVRNGARLATGKPGRKVFTVKAVDTSGNTKTLTVVYRVTR